jgi:hypothetical protein
MTKIITLLYANLGNSGPHMTASEIQLHVNTISDENWAVQVMAAATSDTVSESTAETMGT